jgi:hypothetical protein
MMDHTMLPPALLADAKQLHFGLGCMQFIPKQQRIEGLTIRQYCGLIDQSLRCIPSISDIEIDGPIDDEMEFSGKVGTLREGGYLWPGSGLEVRLSVHIPFRVQDELLQGRVSAATKTEDFGLLLKFEYYSPIAIVSIGSTQGARGSQGVYVLREFLEKSLHDTHACNLLLDIEGPSPFHADFSVVEVDHSSASNDHPITVEIKKQLGYDYVTWRVDTNTCSLERGIDDVLSALVQEADLYYHVKQSRSMLINGWLDAEASAARLMEDSEISSWKERMKSYVMRPGHLKEAVVNLRRFQMQDMTTRADLRRAFNEHKPSDIGGVGIYTAEAIEAVEPFPVRELESLLTFLENRRRHLDNVLIALLAAVVGGLIGGAVALMAG